MKLYFEELHDGHGIQSICDPPSDWKADPEDGYVGFNAYELGYWAFSYEKHLIDEGYEYICCIEFVTDDDVLSVGEFPARDEDDAVRLLQLAADSLYEEEAC